MKTEGPAVDGFDGWSGDIEGHERPDNAGIIQGTMLKFDNTAQWKTRDDDELPDGLELIIGGIERVVQRWQDGKPVNGETRILQPGEKFPDVKALNAAVPETEWEEGPDGTRRGPYQCQSIVYFVDPKTMDRYTYPTGTVGGSIAIRDVKDKTIWMRRVRGANVFPVVTLGDVFMNTRFGGRQRPHFQIVRWVRLGGEGAGEAPALPAPAETAALPVVDAPSMADDFLNDSIDDIGTEVAEPPKPPKVTKIGKKKVA